MNVLITLPKGLIGEILSGDKKILMRKIFPKNLKIGSDGFFVVEKGTSNVRCWCRVDSARQVYITRVGSWALSRSVCVSPAYIRTAARYREPVWLCDLGRVRALSEVTIDDLIIERNPRSFCYCHLSYGESF